MLYTLTMELQQVIPCASQISVAQVKKVKHHVPLCWPVRLAARYVMVHTQGAVQLLPGAGTLRHTVSLQPTSTAALVHTVECETTCASLR